jgi:hypothetical protein
MRRERLPPERLQQAGLFLLLLVSADTAFLIVHLAHELSPFFGNRLFSLATDGGYSEIFQYVKNYWIVILLAALSWRTRERVYATWMLLYAYVLWDDAFQVHERGGKAIAKHWGYGDALGLRAQDFGELTVAGAFGLTFLVLIGMMYLRSAHDARNASKDLALLLCVMVFFGVIVDMLHIAASRLVGHYAGMALGVVEDWGEMLAMSVVCWYVLNLPERRGYVPASLWQQTRTVLVRARGPRT